MTSHDAYTDAERDAVYRVIKDRRDIRKGFRADPIPDETLIKILAAAHSAPSVGGSQPWDFLLVSSPQSRQAVHDHVVARQDAYAAALPPARSAAFARLRIDAILATPVNIVITCDTTRGGWYTLGAPDESQGLARSVDYAIENLWLAARAEGIGVCLVGAFDPEVLAEIFHLPASAKPVAYLCLGYVDQFPDSAELVLEGWSRKRPLAWAVHRERFGRRGLPGAQASDIVGETVAAIKPGEPTRTNGLRPAAIVVFAGTDAAGQVEEIVATSSFARVAAAKADAELCVVDVGLADDLPVRPGLLRRRPSASSGINGAREIGIETARDFYGAGNNCLAAVLLTGDDAEIQAAVGLVLGAAALGVPVVVAGPGSAAARSFAATISAPTGAACVAADGDGVSAAAAAIQELRS